MVQGGLDALGRLIPGRATRPPGVVRLTEKPTSMTRVLLTGAILAVLPLLGGCEDRQGAFDTGREPPFPGAAESLERLGEQVLTALAAGDTFALERVRLTEAEHNEVIWPELPAAAPEANFPVELAWRNIEMRNRRDRARILPWYAGRALTLEKVECRGALQSFRSFSVHTDCWVVFRDDEGGRFRAQVFKDVAERNGGFKIFRYYDEDPRPIQDPGSSTRAR